MSESTQAPSPKPKVSGPACGLCGAPVRMIDVPADGRFPTVAVPQYDDRELREARELMRLLLQSCGDRSICAGCKAVVVWLKTKNGKSVIYDLDGRSHWATCPNSAEFKKRKARNAAAGGS